MRVPLRITPQRVLQRFILIAFVTATVNAALPTELDPFLERLFDTVECEPFLAEAKYFSVATTECHPYTCNFPVQMCMREAAKFQDESANQCINLPTDCLTAANGGIPVSSGAPHIVTTPSPRVFGGIAPGVGGVNPADRINGNGRPPVRLVTASPNSPNPGPPPPPERFLPRNGPNAHGDICQQGVPEGRFCGFQLKFTYNKETGNCEQFWFPGCATEATNDNLFGGEQDCKVATSHCSAPAPAVTERPIRIRKPTTAAPPNPTTTTTTPSPFPDYPDSGEVPQPPPPPENRGGGGFGGRGGGGGVDLGSLAGSFMGGGGGGPGGIVGQLLGSGLGGGGGGGSKSSVVPSGYGGNSLGGGDGGSSGGGQPNFIGLIANAVQQVSNKPDGGAAGGAPAAAQWLKNIDAAVDDLSLLQKQDASQLCRMERDVGHRDCATIGWHHRFYFDFASGDCRAFWYLGCGGNLNNFKQLSHCKAICLNKRV